MASQKLMITSAATDITDELNLVADADYILSVDGVFAVRIFEAATAPTDGIGHRVQPGESWNFRVEALPIWVFTRRENTVIVVSSS